MRIKIRQATAQGWISYLTGGGVDLSYPTSKLRRGRVICDGHIASTLNTSGSGSSIVYHQTDLKGLPDMSFLKNDMEYRVRKLTPTECFRLMGFQREDAKKCEQAGISVSAMYKQAGNGIVTNCVQLIMEHLYKAQYDSSYKCTDECILQDIPHTPPPAKIKLTGNILFSGIGCQERGVNNSGCFELGVICTSDIDADAIISYEAIHIQSSMNKPTPDRSTMVNELITKNINYDFKNNKPYNWKRYAKAPTNSGNDYLAKTYRAIHSANNLGDISKINELPYADFWTISSPCTNISLAGKQEGLTQGSGTASSLVWDSARLLQTAKEHGKLPKYLLMENVKNLVSKKFKREFDTILQTLNDLGYNTYWKIINSKDCGIPQNRERVFVVGIRKDIDTGRFEFPQPFDTGIRLEDILIPAEDVEERYYISEESTQYLIDNLIVDGVINEEECIIPTRQQDMYNYYDTNNVYHIINTDRQTDAQLVQGVDNITLKCINVLQGRYAPTLTSHVYKSCENSIVNPKGHYRSDTIPGVVSIK